MWSLNPKGPWHRGCVAVSGDAAHAMPPNMAQGTPMAIEDAVQLAASLQAHGLTEAALAHYEEVRAHSAVATRAPSVTRLKRAQCRVDGMNRR